MSRQFGSDNRRGFWRSPAGLALAVFFVAAAFYLWLEHRAHILGILPRHAVRSPTSATIEKRMTRYARPREEIEGNITRWLSSLSDTNKPRRT